MCQAQRFALGDQKGKETIRNQDTRVNYLNCRRT